MFDMADLIDSIEGDGKVYEKTEFIADVHFKIRVFQNFTMSSTIDGRSRVPGLKAVELEISRISEPIPAGRSIYTLHLGESADRLNFFMEPRMATTVTGGLYKA
jgi:hypothetical protein